MTDLERGRGTCVIEGTENGMAVLTGQAPASEMVDYQAEVISYSKGRGRLSCSLKGYEPCHNTQEVMEKIAYDPERDTENPTDCVLFPRGGICGELGSCKGIYACGQRDFLGSAEDGRGRPGVRSFLQQRRKAEGSSFPGNLAGNRGDRCYLRAHLLF